MPPPSTKPRPIEVTLPDPEPWDLSEFEELELSMAMDELELESSQISNIDASGEFVPESEYESQTDIDTPGEIAPESEYEPTEIIDYDDDEGNYVGKVRRFNLDYLEIGKESLQPPQEFDGTSRPFNPAESFEYLFDTQTTSADREILSSQQEWSQSEPWLQYPSAQPSKPQSSPDFDNDITVGLTVATGKRLPLWARWELERLVQCVPSGDILTASAISNILKECVKMFPTTPFLDLWQDLKSTLEEHLDTKSSRLVLEPPDKTVLAWLQNPDDPRMTKPWDDHIQMTAVISLSKQQGSRSYEPVITLRPLQPCDSSSRQWRKYGADRFLTIDRAMPKSRPIGVNKKEYQTMLLAKLKSGFTFMERDWIAFFHKENDSERARELEIDSASLKFFATHGAGLETVTPRQQIDWCINPFDDANINQSPAKLYSRIQLSLTTTKPTVVFETQNILRVDDIYSGDNCLTDGCCTATAAVFREVAKLLDLDFTPSAIQGRIGGAKGVWIPSHTVTDEDEFKIWISPTQLKFEVSGDNEEYRTLEVSGISKPLRSGYLNNQFLSIFNNNGIPNAVFEEILNEAIDERINSLSENLTNNLAIIQWLRYVGTLGRGPTEEGVTYGGSIPIDVVERVVMLLESGFTLSNNWFLKEALKKLLPAAFSGWTGDKLKIQLPQSTYVLCVPDFTGTLGPNEIFLNMSRSLGSGEGQSRGILLGDVIVGRSPAYVESDLQKVQAVSSAALLRLGLVDVAVFSTKGERSLVSYLSGGDYDGDKVFITWDPRILSNFTNRPECLEPWEDYMEKTGPTTMRHLLELSNQSTEAALESMMSTQLDRGIQGNEKGRITRLHEKVIYHLDVEHQLAKTLAAIATALVDAPKQGIVLKKDKYQELLAKISTTLGHTRSRLRPLYQEERIHYNTFTGRLRDEINVIDYLRFCVGEKRLSELKKVYEQDGPGDCNDPDLTHLYHTHIGYYEDMYTGLRDKLKRGMKFHKIKDDGLLVNNHEAIAKVFNMREIQDFFLSHEIVTALRRVVQKVERVVDEWKKFYAKKLGGANAGMEDPSASGSGANALDELEKMENAGFNNRMMEAFRDIVLGYGESEDICENALVRNWMMDKSHWALVRASLLFVKAKGAGTSAAVWVLAGEELCRIKAQAVAAREAESGRRFRSLMSDVYDGMKVEVPEWKAGPKRTTKGPTEDTWGKKA